MKLTKKLMAAAAGLICAAVTFTSCGAFGKDDFYGTWVTSYNVTEENAAPGETDKVGSKVDLTMYFNGKSESLFAGKENKIFWQYRTRTPKTGAPINTFYCGYYDLADHSNVTEGTLTLTYLYGWNGITKERAQELVDIFDGTTSVPDEYKDRDAFMQAQAPSVTYKTDPKDGTVDIEVFKFELGKPTWKGYTEMTATAEKNCTWEVKSRTFTLSTIDSDLNSALDMFKKLADAEK